MWIRSIDEKLKEIGFVKTYVNDKVVEYDRYNDTYDYIQSLSFVRKKSGNHILISSQKDLNKDGFSNAVGLTKKELKLCYKKLKELWK